MRSSTGNGNGEARGNAVADRIGRLKAAVMETQPGICPERALIWTDYFRTRAHRAQSPHAYMAGALAEVLARKSVAIHPDELIVGNYTSKRVGGSLFPELHGLPVLMDLFKFSSRETNRLRVSGKEKFALLKIVPFWMFRFLGIRAYRSPLSTMRLLADQLKAHFYLINESGGISHIAPDYEALIRMGTDGFRAKADALQAGVERGSEPWHFYEAVKTIAEGLARFGERYAALAERMADKEKDAKRKRELAEIAQACRQVPRHGARNFREAVQSLFFAQIALNLESLDNSVCPGRVDQYLYPYYAADLREGRITREGAKELLACLSIKMAEIIPVFSRHMTNFHGGMFNGQVVTVGGVDREGKDGVNDLSFIVLEIMDELRMRQPNYHARVHAGSPAPYLDKIWSMLASGSNSPALYGDETIIETMKMNGYTPEDARDYTAVGCVEPVCQGKSFSSTDAAIFNTPLCLEMALNGGRRFGRLFRSGVKTMSASRMKSMDDVVAAFGAQLEHALGRLIRDLRAIEEANRNYHPTPLTSMLLDGCLERGKCSTAGGARYNFSGIQCVAPVDTGDALRAIEKAVFQDGALTLPGLVSGLKRNLPDESMRTALKGIEKFGNDCEEADRWTRRVTERFAAALRSFGMNTRGGAYVMGLYSVTAHEYFGRITGALPHGRRKGEPFASGISPLNGADRKGPTAVLNSVNSLDHRAAANGVNFNLKFTPLSLRGEEGRRALGVLMGAYFRRGGMQAQVNVLDPEMLLDARNDPGKYPHLLVRVSGYSAYFNDLTPAMKDEIIRRSSLEAC
ncbi:MAG: formate acetyltransferase [Spirochaetes bacterium]|nr:MAG: formate acetyltransferase [Spirochaetota bacterium]